MAEPPSIWVVGAPSVGKCSLVQAITKSPVVSRSAHPWEIDTKYYTVSTQFLITHPGSSSNFSGEAVVLVIDAEKQESFAAVQAWSGVAESEEAGVRLVVATNADRLDSSPVAGGMLEPKRPAWLNDAIDWCAENSLEYIECSTTNPATDAKLVLDGDKQGISRVVEALQSHMWPGLVRKQPGRAHGEGGAHAARSAADPDGTGNSFKHIASQPATEPASCQCSSIAAAPPSSSKDGASAAQNGSSKATTTTTTTTGAAAADGSDDSGKDEEEDMEAFEALMFEMAGVCVCL